MFGKRLRKAVSSYRDYSYARVSRSDYRGLNTEIASNTEAVVYGIKNIVDYTPECVKLGHKTGLICFCGRGLSCQSFVEGAVCIRGNIDSVQFDKI